MLYFNYLNLEEILNKFHKSNINNVDLTLIISLEKDYYMGENMKLIMSDLRRLMNNKEIVWNIDGKLEKFKIRTLRFDVGDVLNRHMFYYRHCADYFDKNNIDQEELIPLEIRKDFEEKSYIEGKEEGKDWFKSNIDAFNLFSNEKVLTKDYYIGDDITTIFEETEDTPKLEYICYEHWYKHYNYNNIYEILLELTSKPDMIMDRCYVYEANYFYNRLSMRGETPKYKNTFIQQSKKYLIDETAAMVILNSANEPNNNFDMYYFGKLPHHFNVYYGKQAKNNQVLQDYIKNNYLIRNLASISQVSIREKK